MKKTSPIIERLMSGLLFAPYLSAEAQRALRNALIVAYAAGGAASARTVRNYGRVFHKRSGK